MDTVLLIYKIIWFIVLVVAMGGAIWLFACTLHRSIKGKDEEVAYVGRFYDKDNDCFRLMPQKHEWKDILMLIGVFFLYRLVAITLTYIIKVIFEPGYTFDITKIFYEFTKWDAHHYLSIADHWYVSEEQYLADSTKYADKEYVFLAFYPLYPIIVRIFGYVFGNLNFSAHFVSNLFFVLSIAAMYKLVRMDFKRQTAIIATLMLILSPYGFFFAFAFTESLFLFLTLMFFIMLKKENWLVAGIFGLFAALTKNFGLIFVVPYGVWLITVSCKRKYNFGKFVLRLLPGFLILAGFGIYLYINKSVSGDWFKFMEYQNNHWHNRISCPLANVVNHFSLFLNEHGSFSNKWFIWFGDVSSICFAMLVCYIGCKKIPFTYTIYSLAFIFLTTTVSWLLSGPRYLLVNFPTYIALAAVSENKAWLRWTIIVGEIILGMIALVGYMTNSNVM